MQRRTSRRTCLCCDLTFQNGQNSKMAQKWLDGVSKRFSRINDFSRLAYDKVFHNSDFFEETLVNFAIEARYARFFEQ